MCIMSCPCCCHYLCCCCFCMRLKYRLDRHRAKYDDWGERYGKTDWLDASYLYHSPFYAILLYAAFFTSLPVWAMSGWENASELIEHTYRHWVVGLAITHIVIVAVVGVIATLNSLVNFVNRHSGVRRSVFGALKSRLSNLQFITGLRQQHVPG